MSTMKMILVSVVLRLMQVFGASGPPAVGVSVVTSVSLTLRVRSRSRCERGCSSVRQSRFREAI